MEDKVRKEAGIKRENKRIENNVRGIPPRKKGKVDFVLLIVVIALSLLGLYMVLSTTYYSNLVHGVSPYKTFIKQGVFFVIGLGLMLFFMLTDDYTWLKSHAVIIWVIGVLLLIAVLVFGKTEKGASRWLHIFGMSIQPSEFVKYMTVIALAAYIHHFPFQANTESKGLRLSNESKRYFYMVLIYLIPLALIVLEKALSMTIVVALSCLIITICSGINMIEIGITAIGGVIGAGVFVIMEPWRLKRITEFFAWKTGQPVNLKDNILQSYQSRLSIAAGGLSGKGMIDSRQKFSFLPESDTDFVFSIIGEEFGFIWLALIIILYAIIMIRGIRIAQRARCRFGAYLALGITLLFTFQTLINMFVATTIIPVTGQALPLISQGGSSLLSHMAALGILLNISRETT